MLSPQCLVSEFLLNPCVPMSGSFPESPLFPMDVTDVTLPVLLQGAIREMTQPGTMAGVVKYMQFTEEVTHTHAPRQIMSREKERLLNWPVGIVSRSPLSRGRVKLMN